MCKVPVIDIGNDEAVFSQAPVRRLVYIVLLLATKDRATEVRFEPSDTDSEWKLRYEVGGRWYDMVPVPLNIPISQEIRHMARLRFASAWQRLCAWHTDKSAPDASALRLVISGKGIEITASFHRWGSGSRALEAVVLRLPPTTVLAEQAGSILGDYCRKHLHEVEQTGGPADQSAAADRPRE